MSLRWTCGIRSLVILGCAAAIGALVAASPARAVVKIFDGFGDADLDNNNVPLEPNDVDVSGAGDSTVEPYIALGNAGSPMLFPMDTMVNEVTAVENAADRGIRWFSISGWTGAPSYDPRVSVHIIDDSAASLPETDPAIGYFHSLASTPGTRFAAAIDNGLALAAEAKGRANQFAGFFDNTIQLGPEVNDAVKVSFDFRLWFSAPNLNTSDNINHIPAVGELRFGLFADTDNQFGQTNTQAGRPDEGGTATSAVWGQEHGYFRGDVGTVGANGDHGWFARIPIDDAENTSGRQKFDDGEESRIVEETNDETSPTDRRILNGTSDFVARPDILDPQFVNLDVDRVYNLSMTLTRFDDPDTEGDAGDTIMATVTVIDRATGQQLSFGNYEPVINSSTLLPDGISSDAWDYFVMGSAGSTDSDDFDWIIDNFKVELFGSNAGGLPGDYNNDNTVDAADYTVWRDHLGQANEDGINGNGDGGGVTASDYQFWKDHFGTSLGSGGGAQSSAVPEPGSLALLLGIAVAGSCLRRQTKD